MDTVIALVTLALYATTILVGTIVWGIRLEGKVDKHEAVDTQRFDNMNERHEEIIERLKRIESKQDKLNGVRNANS